MAGVGGMKVNMTYDILKYKYLNEIITMLQ